MSQRGPYDSSSDLIVQMLQGVQGSINQVHGKIDSFHSELRDHYREDAEGFAGVNGQVASLRERLTKVETNDARDDQERVAGFSTNGTGRHRVVPEQDAREIVIPTPPAGMPVDIRIGKRHSSRPPMLSWLGKSIAKAAGSGIGKAAGAVALIGVGVLGRHIAQPAPETKIVTVEVPASASVAPVATAPVVAATSPAPSASADAGKTRNAR